MKKFDTEQQRKAFEAWAYSNKWNIFRVRDVGLDHYVDDFVNGAWHGWIAAQQQDGYVMVPVEPTLETMQKMNREFIDSKFNTPKHRMQQVYKAIIQAAQE